MSAARLRGVVLTCRLLNTAAATFTAAVSATFSTASNSAATAFSAAFSSAADCIAAVAFLAAASRKPRPSQPLENRHNWPSV